MNEVYEVGETVTIQQSGRIPKLVTVARITPSGRIVVTDGKHETTFNVDGSVRGGGMWNYCHIHKTTQSDLDRIEKLKLSIAIDKIDWRELSIVELRSVLHVLGIEVR